MPKFILIFFILFSISITTPIMAQVKGGRKKEHRNQRGGGSKIFKGKSKGNAGSFAKGGNKRGFFARIFKSKKSGSAWVYRKTNPGAKQRREQPKLFSRSRTKGKLFTDGIIAQQSKHRSKSRVRGNKSFSKRKH